MKNKEIITERLLLKPLSKEHLTDQYLSWLNDKETTQFINNSKIKYDFTALENYINNVIEKKIFCWAIHLINTKKHIGNIKIDPIIPVHKVGSYGILMGDKTEWNKGYAKEASIAVIKFCFEEIGIRKITLEVTSKNKAAYHLYKKIGFESEGKRKFQEYYDGVYYDSHVMAIFNSKFKYEN